MSSRAIGNQDVIIAIETRREKTDCWRFCSKQTLRQPRNGVTDWSIVQLLTDNWLICGEVIVTRHNQLLRIFHRWKVP